MVTRRRFLQLAGCATTTSLVPGCGTPPLPKSRFPDFGDPVPPWLGLATSLPTEYDYEAQITGTLPAGLRGTLFRNGPGLFERGNERKRSLLDGDGMIQRFIFHDSGVRYTNRFVRTAKYVAEEEAGRFLYPTWSTMLPGGVWSNFWSVGSIATQAGITVFPFNGLLYAFDESALPYTLDPATLETLGQSRLGVPETETVLFAAHAKFDPATGEWLHFGLEYGPTARLHLVTLGRNGGAVRHRTFPLPRFVYQHDWFVSPGHVILCLHPVEIEYWGLLLGLRSVIDSLRWKPKQGNLLMIIPRDGVSDPVVVEAPPAFLWHSINAWEQGDELVAEFVGYASPDHFIGPNAVAQSVMAGKIQGAFSPGLIRRYLIHPGRRTVREEIMGTINVEWPRINETKRGQACRYVYLITGRQQEFFWSGMCRADLVSGKTEVFDFGPGRYTSEPVFIPQTNGHAGNDERGWLLSEVYDSSTRRSFLALLKADHLGDGPIAEVHLRHHVPFSYHGSWMERSDAVNR